MPSQFLVDILNIFKVIGCFVTGVITTLCGVLAGNFLARLVVRWRKDDADDSKTITAIFNPLRTLGGSIAACIWLGVGILQITSLDELFTVDETLFILAKTSLQACIVVWILAGLAAALYWLVQTVFTKNSSTGDLPLENWEEYDDQDGIKGLLGDTDVTYKSR